MQLFMSFMVIGGIYIVFGGLWHLVVGLLRVSEYSDIHWSDKKIEFEYYSLPKSLERNLFSFLFFNNWNVWFFRKIVQVNVLQSEFKE